MITALPTTYSIHARGISPARSVSVVQGSESWECKKDGYWLSEGFSDHCPHVRRAMEQQRNIDERGK